MNTTEKYGIKMKYNHHGQIVNENFQDEGENFLIELFESEILKLKNSTKEKWTMLELGSNFAYYSMLFKKILGPDQTECVMIEPWSKFLQTGIEHFQLNNLEGKFLYKRIYNPQPWAGVYLDAPSTGIDELLKEMNIEDLDVYHCDIDSSELIALNTAHESLSQKKIDLLFILTHPENGETSLPTKLHQACKEKLLGYDYELIVDHPECDIAGDGLLLFKRK